MFIMSVFFVHINRLYLAILMFGWQFGRCQTVIIVSVQNRVIYIAVYKDTGCCTQVLSANSKVTIATQYALILYDRMS